MPHDKNGTKIEEGDIITLRCRATNVQASTETACNVTAEPLDGPTDEYRPRITCNTRLFEKSPPASA